MWKKMLIYFSIINYFSRFVTGYEKIHETPGIIIGEVCLPQQIAELERYLDEFDLPEAPISNTATYPYLGIDDGAVPESGKLPLESVAVKEIELMPLGALPVDWKRLRILYDLLTLPEDGELKSKFMIIYKILIAANQRLKKSARNTVPEETHTQKIEAAKNTPNYFGDEKIDSTGSEKAEEKRNFLTTSRQRSERSTYNQNYAYTDSSNPKYEEEDRASSSSFYSSTGMEATLNSDGFSEPPEALNFDDQNSGWYGEIGGKSNPESNTVIPRIEEVEEIFKDSKSGEGSIESFDEVAKAENHQLETGRNSNLKKMNTDSNFEEIIADLKFEESFTDTNFTETNTDSTPKRTIMDLDSEVGDTDPNSKETITDSKFDQSFTDPNSRESSTSPNSGETVTDSSLKSTVMDLELINTATDSNLGEIVTDTNLKEAITGSNSIKIVTEYPTSKLNYIELSTVENLHSKEPEYKLIKGEDYEEDSGGAKVTGFENRKSSEHVASETINEMRSPSPEGKVTTKEIKPDVRNEDLETRITTLSDPFIRSSLLLPIDQKAPRYFGGESSSPRYFTTPSYLGDKNLKISLNYNKGLNNPAPNLPADTEDSVTSATTRNTLILNIAESFSNIPRPVEVALFKKKDRKSGNHITGMRNYENEKNSRIANPPPQGPGFYQRNRHRIGHELGGKLFGSKLPGFKNNFHRTNSTGRQVKRGGHNTDVEKLYRWFYRGGDIPGKSAPGGAEVECNRRNRVSELMRK